MTAPASPAPCRNHPAAIAWIDAPAPAGRWGHPDALAAPLSDRGLLLADGIFETVLVLDGHPRLLAEHLERWRASAALLAMEPPPEAERVDELIRQAITRSGIASGALRLNWSRGSPAAPGARGLAIPPGCRHRFWLQLSPTSPCLKPVRVIVSPTETRSATSLLSRAKTFAYGSAIGARRQAAAADADDALLASSAGGLCCGTSANLLVRADGGTWLTPPQASGCLPGVMRARALELGLAREAVIEVADLAASSGALLLNSLGCRPISHLESEPLPWATDTEGAMALEAERLWRQLLAA
jgi:branched-subunit amino acid aminotransferase/4-amino-4-deoxychorismate lyase